MAKLQWCRRMQSRKYPDNLSATQGAAIWMQYITAWGALIHYGNLQVEQTILITAAVVASDWLRFK